MKLYSKPAGNIAVSDFNQEDRERAMELLLSQERVLTLLYAKTFPIATKPGGLSLENSNSSTGEALHTDDIALASEITGMLPSIVGVTGNLGGAGSVNRPRTGADRITASGKDHQRPATGT